MASKSSAVSYYPADSVALPAAAAATASKPAKPIAAAAAAPARAHFEASSSNKSSVAVATTAIQSEMSSDKRAASRPTVTGTAASPIGDHMSGGHRRAITHGQLIKLLDVRGSTHVKAQKRHVSAQILVNLKRLISDKEYDPTLRISKEAAALFQKPVFDPVTKTTHMTGDFNSAQVTKVCLKSYTNELPIRIGLESFELHGNMAPRVVSNDNGRLVTAILEPETRKEYRADERIVLHDNPNVFSTSMVSSWAGVTEAMLREHSEYSAMSGTTKVNLTKNARMRFLLNKNARRLVRDYKADVGFNLSDLYYQIEKKRREKKDEVVELPPQVFETLVEIGLKLGVNPVTENTLPLYSVGFRPVSLTSKDGDFSDLKAYLDAKFGTESSEDMMTSGKTYEIHVMLEMEVVLAGMEDGHVGSTRARSNSDAGSGSESDGGSAHSASDGEQSDNAGHSGASSGAASDAE